LGRAQQIGEFVKHNTGVAEVEIELQRRSYEAKNHVVRLRISKENNGREFFLDNRKTALKSIQDLTKGFNIQVDNLCQFLPQDKVSEFAALSPVELLQQTQRAAAPPEMLEQHDKLKDLRREQRKLDQQLEGDKENLGRMETRQEGLRAERERLEERQQIEETVKVLRKTVPFVEYRAARKQHAEFKKKKKEAQKCLEDLETELAPTLQSIEQKETYAKQITAAARDRKTALENAEKDAGKLTNTIDTIEETIKQYHAKIDSERQEEQKRKKEFRDLERNISNMKARLNDPKIDFNGPEWNERIVS
jgi:chromosome segregation ATPase